MILDSPHPIEPAQAPAQPALLPDVGGQLARYQALYAGLGLPDDSVLDSRPVLDSAEILAVSGELRELVQAYMALQLRLISHTAQLMNFTNDANAYQARLRAAHGENSLKATLAYYIFCHPENAIGTHVHVGSERPPQFRAVDFEDPAHSVRGFLRMMIEKHSKR